MPANRMCALICVYQNRPLASTVMTTSTMLKYCTGAGSCVDNYYNPDNFSFGTHAYWSDGNIFLMADAGHYSAVFIIF